MDAVTDEITRVECPQGCDFVHLEHVHLQHKDGCGQVWGAVDGQARLLDPFDLQRTAVTLLPPRRRKR